MAGLHKAGKLLLEHGKEAIWAHSQAVAEEIRVIADQYGLDAEACETAALCHDIGGILSPQAMLEQAEIRGFSLDPAEAGYPFLLHQRYSAFLCGERLGIADDRVLSAVGCHTTLKAGASDIDMALFLADKLAWDQPGTPPYEAAMRGALQASLAAASLAYIDYAMAHGMILMPHRWLLEARAWLRR